MKQIPNTVCIPSSSLVEFITYTILLWPTVQWQGPYKDSRARLDRISSVTNALRGIVINLHLANQSRMELRPTQAYVFFLYMQVNMQTLPKYIQYIALQS